MAPRWRRPGQPVSSPRDVSVRRWRAIPFALAALAAIGCADSTAPEEARYPIVEGLYNVDTSVVSNTCAFGASDGARVYVFFQEPGGGVSFRPPAFDGQGSVTLLDLGIEGRLEPSGAFLLRGTYRLDDTPLIVAFTMEGRFDGDTLEAVEHHLASFVGGACEVTFSISGSEV